MGLRNAVASARPYAICTSLQTDNHTNTPSLNFYRPGALPDAQTTVSNHWRWRKVAVNVGKWRLGEIQSVLCGPCSAGDSRHCGGEDGRVGLGVKNRQHPRQPEPRRTPCRPAETSPQNRRAYQTDTRQLLRPVPRCCSESALFISNNVPTSDAVIHKLIFSFWSSLRKSGSVVICSFMKSDLCRCSQLLTMWRSLLF